LKTRLDRPEHPPQACYFCATDDHADHLADSETRSPTTC
jgi:hypothetical protein